MVCLDTSKTTAVVIRLPVLTLGRITASGSMLYVAISRVCCTIRV